MNRVRAELLATVPASIEAAVSVNTLAARVDVAHHIVREHLRALVRAGIVASTDGAVVRYFKTGEQIHDPHSEPRVGERVILALPMTEAEAKTIRELAIELLISPASVNSAMAPYRDQGHVLRVGAGGQRSPYRYYVDLPFELDDDGHIGPIAPPELDKRKAPDPAAADGAPTPADALGLIRGAETAASEAATSSVTPDQDDAGTEVPPDPDRFDIGPVEDYSAAPELAADMIGDHQASPHAASTTGDLRGSLLGAAELAAAYELVIGDVEARAVESRHDARVLDAAAELLHRIHQDRLDL